MSEPRVSSWSCPVPLQDYPQITLGHGGGGKLSAELFEHLIKPIFQNPILNEQTDAAALPPMAGRLCVTTDSFVVRPLFFPGGSIGELAVHGTINDLAMMGAIPRYLTLALILEEGLSVQVLADILHRMSHAANSAGVQIVGGDTKVIERTQGDGCMITTSGIGVLPSDKVLSPKQVRPGDKLILSGTIAEHGLAVLSQREGLEFDSPIRSDTAALHDLVAEMLQVGEIRMLRDPTRGGLATTLNEIATAAGLGLAIQEASVPIDPTVQGVCEMLGLDPWAVANEGKLVAVVAADSVKPILAAMQAHPLGRKAAIIGEVVPNHPGYVVAHTRFGTTRIVPLPAGELLPRIC